MEVLKSGDILDQIKRCTAQSIRGIVIWIRCRDIKNRSDVMIDASDLEIGRGRKECRRGDMR